MKLLTEKIVNTDYYAGRLDIITEIDDFESPVKYDADKHQYFLDGKELPSVTRLIDDGTFDDLRDNPYVIYACKKGTIVHDEIEQWLLTGKTGFTKELQNFIRLFNDNQELFEQEAIFDVKTSTKLDKEKTLKQMEMYAKGVEYLTGKVITNFYAIHLPKNTKGKIVKL